MPITILSPYSGKPVKVRDQDVGRAIRDEEGRIFYIVDATDGGGPYASMTRKGSDKDLERYRKLESGSVQLTQTARENVRQVHDATGKTRRNPVGLLLLVVVLLALAAAGYVYFMRPDLVPWLNQNNTNPQPTPGEQDPGGPADEPSGEPTTRLNPDAGGGDQASAGEADVVADSGVWVSAFNPTFLGRDRLLLSRAAAWGGPAPTVAAVDEEPVAVPTWRPGGALPVSTDGVDEPDPLAGFRVTASGMRYKVIERGSGRPAGAGNFVAVRYAAYTMDGRSLVDDATHEFVLAAGQSIRALDEGLAGVRPGGQRVLFVPKGHSPVGRLPGVDTLPAEAFLLEVQLLGVRPGVTWIVEAEGRGEPALPGDRVVLDYAGYVEGRAEPFDSSELRGRPMELTLGDGSVIPGLAAGLMGIMSGETRLVTIPAYLAYGEQGVAGGLIPPNAVLTYRLTARAVRPADEER